MNQNKRILCFESSVYLLQLIDTYFARDLLTSYNHLVKALVNLSDYYI